MPMLKDCDLRPPQPCFWAAALDSARKNGVGGTPSGVSGTALEAVLGPRAPGADRWSRVRIAALRAGFSVDCIADCGVSRIAAPMGIVRITDYMLDPLLPRNEAGAGPARVPPRVASAAADASSKKGLRDIR
eukprot:6827732-Alexandrium_andersonii.AAC.3